MVKSLGLAVLGLTLVGVSARADEHLVGPETVAARLNSATAAREAQAAAVDDLLTSPGARHKARALGADVDQLRLRVAALSDAELADLYARVSSLKTDPAAGLDKDIHDLLVIFLIVAIVLIVLKSV